MRLASLAIILVPTLTLTSACSPKEPGSTTDEPATETAATDPTAATESDPTAATEPDPTDTGATDGTMTDGTATDTDGLPAECTNPPDPPVSAAFSIEGAGWLDDLAFLDVDVQCTVTAVTVEAEVVRTDLACDLEGEPQTATFSIPVAPEGDVAWDVDQAVRLRVGASQDFANILHVRLHAADTESLLAVAVAGGGDNGPASLFLPVTYELLPVCGDLLDSIDITPQAIEFGLADDGPKVQIFSGARDVLPIDGQQVFAIDVGRIESGYCCHYSTEAEIVLRRVRVGG